MGIMMIFESSPEIDLRMLRDILTECGAVPFDDETFNFKNSNMYCVIANPSKLVEVDFLGLDYSPWIVKSRLIFHYARFNFSECSAQLHDFIGKVGLLEGEFFLSFQNEMPCAVKSEHEILIWDRF